jgi:hypothetical protein
MRKRYSEITEADESAADKATALRNLEWQVLSHQGQGLIDMFEFTALTCGATLDETEGVIAAARQAAAAAYRNDEEE